MMQARFHCKCQPEQDTHLKLYYKLQSVYLCLNAGQYKTQRQTKENLKRGCEENCWTEQAGWYGLQYTSKQPLYGHVNLC